LARQSGAASFGPALDTFSRTGFVVSGELGVRLPDVDGFDVAAWLTSQDDGPAVVLTSSRDGSGFGGMVARSGARGFVPKEELSGPALEALLG
jgi:DNA-binding NarL/FixJ family response regulator